MEAPAAGSWSSTGPPAQWGTQQKKPPPPTTAPPNALRGRYVDYGEDKEKWPEHVRRMDRLDYEDYKKNPENWDEAASDVTVWRLKAARLAWLANPSGPTVDAPVAKPSGLTAVDGGDAQGFRLLTDTETPKQEATVDGTSVAPAQPTESAYADYHKWLRGDKDWDSPAPKNTAAQPPLQAATGATLQQGVAAAKAPSASTEQPTP